MSENLLGEWDDEPAADIAPLEAPDLDAGHAGKEDDGLEFYVSSTALLREDVRIARSLKDGSFVQHDRVHHLTSRCVRLVTEPSLSVNLDGETATATPTYFTV